MIPNASTQSERAVSNLHDLLEKICKSPSEFIGDSELLVALKRQARLGAYQNTLYGVTPTSRSTIERVCNRMLPGGISNFDGLRRRALEELKAVSQVMAMLPRPRKRTREHYRQRSIESEEKVKLALVDCWHLTGAVYEAIQAGRSLVEELDDPLIRAKWRRHEAVVLARLSLSKKLIVTRGSEVEQWAETVREL